MPTPKPYVAVLITFAGTTAVRLIDAVLAVEPTAGKTCKSLNIENSWSTAAGTKLFVGDSAVSSTRYGHNLDVGQSHFWPPGSNPPVGDIYLFPEAAGTISCGVEMNGCL